MKNNLLKSNQQGITSKNSRDITNPVYLSWLGGFVEGEGSASVSIVVNRTSIFINPGSPRSHAPGISFGDTQGMTTGSTAKLSRPGRSILGILWMPRNTASRFRGNPTQLGPAIYDWGHLIFLVLFLFYCSVFIL